MKVERTAISAYFTKLVEPGRPPSRGGNTRAHHQHTVLIGEDRYSFLALGSRKWIFSSDTVEFEWDWDPTGKYRNINEFSIFTWDKKGEPVKRGHRGTKAWRTASSRPR